MRGENKWRTTRARVTEREGVLQSPNIFYTIRTYCKPLSEKHTGNPIYILFYFSITDGKIIPPHLLFILNLCYVAQISTCYSFCSLFPRWVGSSFKLWHKSPTTSGKIRNMIQKINAYLRPTFVFFHSSILCMCVFGKQVQLIFFRPVTLLLLGGCLRERAPWGTGELNAVW